MPFSGIIVGLGDSDFADMEILDADDQVLQDDADRMAARDIVQLVRYNDFKELGMRELALQVLDELPNQFVDYMLMKETEPESVYNPPPEQVEVVRLL